MSNGQIIVIGGEKGGVGKSTVTAHLAVMLTTMGYSVCVVDADKQKSVNKWAGIRNSSNINPFIMVDILSGKLERALTEKASKYDVVLVDTGGGLTAEQVSSCLVANQIIFPMSSSGFETWSIETLIEMVNSANNFRPEDNPLTATILLNKAGRSPYAEQNFIKETLKALAERANQADTTIQVLDSYLTERKCMSDSIAFGVTGIEVQANSKAIHNSQVELKNLYKELFGENYKHTDGE